MSAELFLEKFGYVAVFIGTFFEGETILVLAGFFSEQNYLSLPLVIIVGFLGAYSGHIFWFWLGRARGLRIVNHFPRMQKHLGQGIRLFERYGIPAIFISQYLYGLRITCAIVVGISRISVAKFLFYQGLSCLTWTIIIAHLGVYFGRAVETLLGKAAHVEKYALIAIVTIAVLLYAWHRWKERKEETGIG
ncbi:MAG TPA: DedA family protein [Thermoanaerobaculia bacterium]|nr:DedA family protein [Thermoanaerobaculia bacterium]